MVGFHSDHDGLRTSRKRPPLDESIHAGCFSLWPKKLISCYNVKIFLNAMNLSLKQKKGIAIALIFLMVMIATGLMVKLGALDRLQLQISAALYQTRNSSTPIVIVGVDQQTTEKMGPTGAWTRDIYAQAIDNISKYNPAVIGLDYAFISKGKVLPVSTLDQIITESQSSEEVANNLTKLVGNDLLETDQAFAKTIRENNKLVMIRPPILNFNLDNLRAGKLDIQSPYAAFTPADQNNLGVSISIDEPDGSLRKYIPVVNSDKDYLSFGLAIVGKYWNTKSVLIDEFNADQAVIKFDDKVFKIPLKDFQFLMNFSDKFLHGDNLQAANLTNQNYKYLHFVDVYNNQWDSLNPSELAGKIVLIGPYSQNTDTYKVPIDKDYRMPGVMIHGQAIQTILDQAWLRDMSLPETFAVSAMLVALALGMVFGLSIFFALIGVILEIVIYCLAGFLLFKTGLIINLIYPPLAVILAVIIAYAYRYLTEFKQKNKVAGALGQYVNADVAQSVLESNQNVVKSGGEKKLISILFSDIAGFTTISEGMTPENLVKLLNEYFEVMAGAIERSGGIIDKYIGDAIMALFEGENHAEKAALAALEMRRALTEWKATGEADRARIDFRVGVACGEVVVGNIGSSQHIQYTAIGDIVNLASRLEGANKYYGTRVMVSEAFYEAIAQQFELRFLDIITVKGKSNKVNVYELIAPKGQLSDEQMRLVTAYNHGLEKYFARDFKGAQEVFQKEVLANWPNDFLANFYEKRCGELVKNPPAADWNFVFKMENK